MKKSGTVQNPSRQEHPPEQIFSSFHGLFTDILLLFLEKSPKINMYALKEAKTLVGNHSKHNPDDQYGGDELSEHQGRHIRLSGQEQQIGPVLCAQAYFRARVPASGGRADLHRRRQGPGGRPGLLPAGGLGLSVRAGADAGAGQQPQPGLLPQLRNQAQGGRRRLRHLPDGGLPQHPGAVHGRNPHDPGHSRQSGYGPVQRPGGSAATRARDACSGSSRSLRPI